MTIDTKRLATDPGYWGELGAPDDATHAANRHDKQPGREFRVCWYRKDQGFYFRYPESDGWEPCANGEPAHQPIIPRPQKPEVEWDGEGLPPVGAELDYVIGDDRYPVTVVGHFDGEVVVFQHESAPDYVGVHPGYLQPIITKEQRHRDDLANYLGDLLTSAGWEPDMRDAGDLADAILSRYNLEPKDA